MPSGKESPWEVVDHRIVTPVWDYQNDDVSDDVDLIHVSQSYMRGTYFFDVKDGSQHVQRALVFARQQFLKATSQRGYNTLLTEGWQVTTFRKGAKRRVEVQYRARPALISGDVPGRSPPFIELLSNQLD